MPSATPAPNPSDAGPHQGWSVLHLDSNILVVDKPSGLLSVPAKPPATHANLLDALLGRFGDVLLVHRLDRDTSGVLVFARTRLAQRHLGWQSERRQVSKTYLAVVDGAPAHDAGRIEVPLVCDWPRRPMQKPCFERGRASTTDWRVLARGAESSRLEVRPRTGRSHQIRVHLLVMGYPVIGDPFYGRDPDGGAGRMLLHAHTLRFRHPDGGAAVEFTAPAPF